MKVSLFLFSDEEDISITANVVRASILCICNVNNCGYSDIS